MIIAPGFADLLSDFDLAALEEETSLVFGLSAQLAIAYTKVRHNRDTRWPRDSSLYNSQISLALPTDASPEPYRF